MGRHHGPDVRGARQLPRRPGQLGSARCVPARVHPDRLLRTAHHRGGSRAGRHHGRRPGPRTRRAPDGAVPAVRDRSRGHRRGVALAAVAGRAGQRPVPGGRTRAMGQTLAR